MRRFLDVGVSSSLFRQINKSQAFTFKQNSHLSNMRFEDTLSSSFDSSESKPLHDPDCVLILRQHNTTPETTQCCSPSVDNAALRIRSRFLGRLGISKAQYQQQQQRRRKEAYSTSSLKLKDAATTYEDTLKADYGLPDSSLQPKTFFPKPRAIKIHHDCKSTHKKKGVSFEVNVTVHPIPSRSDYSNRIKTVLWMTPTEMQENTARNCIEFAAENWDWRQVVTEQDMILYGGEHVHPIHFATRPECNLQQHFFAVLQQQKS